MKSIIKFVQHQLNIKGFNVGAADGIAGKKTKEGIVHFLTIKKQQRFLYVLPEQRIIIATAQLIINENHSIDDIEVDGFFGPDTEYAMEVFLHFQTTGSAPALFRDEQDESIATGVNPFHFPKNEYEAMCEYYGEPGDTSTHMMIDLPYAMKLAWDTDAAVRKMTVNKKLGQLVYDALEEVLAIYGIAAIEAYGLDLFGGCYNKRKQRGGSKLSTHAWAAALDFDPARNALRMNGNEAQMAKPAYNHWWKTWEKRGFVSLGRTKNYDWMHIQATQ
jgi:peptidoglycan hydrolase-like protein with peptidoglycan-binding domain